ncbi:MAG: peptidoglycan-binding protein [Cypionkella sp.]|uniref:peptidoglycan-binding domain-containing protein n=1 Tax=Cypionkella sp. TaxID=2811411 RepID=UPI002606A566|nr:peptidoglycan-binding domain-containing protein [Cypionkella sp.]MDB5658400.1 peptidoglycan-binding protein [Cypionkella sp.]
MILRLVLGSALVLAGCAQQIAVTAPAVGNLGVELIRLKEGQQPPQAAGVCWAKDTTPAVIETTTEQIVVTDEQRDDQGKVVAPATYQTKTHQRLLQDHEEVWFRAPCPADMTVNFVATLQRALKARGLYLAPVTGVIDITTAEAVRRFQAERGLDSPALSLAAAKELGIIATDISKL